VEQVQGARDEARRGEAGARPSRELNAPREMIGCDEVLVGVDMAFIPYFPNELSFW
jgi:hypothetical protein